MERPKPKKPFNAELVWSSDTKPIQFIAISFESPDVGQQIEEEARDFGRVINIRKELWLFVSDLYSPEEIVKWLNSGEWMKSE